MDHLLYRHCRTHAHRHGRKRTHARKRSWLRGLGPEGWCTYNSWPNARKRTVERVGCEGCRVARSADGVTCILCRVEQDRSFVLERLDVCACVRVCVCACVRVCVCACVRRRIVCGYHPHCMWLPLRSQPPKPSLAASLTKPSNLRPQPPRSAELGSWQRV